MSQTTYRYQRLDAHYIRMVEARRTDDVRTQNSVLHRIIVECWALGIGAAAYLERKGHELQGSPRPATALPLALPDTVEYRCPGCGKDFGSKQARGAHSKFCRKGGAHD